eukprot:TRINITY_DN846_c2_g1_i2.p1 TRINITY_DN846_c2_g1~~TRINITY_DN846_c2_g1_i2.p1  ORF type:complete len:370 (-),score=97.81 TRINITY_DN846_c2_g1_i2:123-1088(-)
MASHCVVPTKPLGDKRDYRIFSLANRLEVLLISDPETDKAAASLDLFVGSLADPPTAPGLAHFCEHMLFLGNAKYPDEGDYAKFIQEHGGTNNAFTSDEHTNYHFEVNPDGLEGALDRFAQFFISPSFTESATNREMNAVNSEFENGVSQDTWRMDGFFRFAAHPSHPFHHFRVGNLKSLRDDPQANGVDVQRELLRFHDTHYSSNLMKLAVLGKESLDELQALVTPIFSTIKENDAKGNPACGQPYAASMPVWYEIVPEKAMHKVKVQFPLPACGKQYLEKPSRYWSHLFGHEADGSLFALLKKKGWALDLVAGATYEQS